jgi:hypothetical protein
MGKSKGCGSCELDFLQLILAREVFRTPQLGLPSISLGVAIDGADLEDCPLRLGILEAGVDKLSQSA